MNAQDEIEFIKKWIAALDTVCPEARPKMNSVSIRLTGKYISIDQRGEVEACEVERCEKP